MGRGVGTMLPIWPIRTLRTCALAARCHGSLAYTMVLVYVFFTGAGSPTAFWAVVAPCIRTVMTPTTALIVTVTVVQAPTGMLMPLLMQVCPPWGCMHTCMDIGGHPAA